MCSKFPDTSTSVMDIYQLGEKSLAPVSGQTSQKMRYSENEEPMIASRSKNTFVLITMLTLLKLESFFSCVGHLVISFIHLIVVLILWLIGIGKGQTQKVPLIGSIGDPAVGSNLVIVIHKVFQFGFGKNNSIDN